jgi:hypothetical protein
VNTVTIDGEEVSVATPEGKSFSMPLRKLLERIAPQRMDTCGYVLPDGVKCVFSSRTGMVVVHQSPPSVYNLKWITNDSPAMYGEGTTYRSVRIALPYLLTLAVYQQRPGGRMRLSDWNECYFRTRPLRSPDDRLLYPALLNCSRFEPPDARPLSWICTQFMKRTEFEGLPTAEERFRGGLRALRQHLLESGFNLSSEQHELTSWFTATVQRGIDPRVSSIEAWEAATREEPLFVLDVPWLETGYTLRTMVDRIFSVTVGRQPEITSARDLARLIVNAHRGSQWPRRRRTLFDFTDVTEGG